MIVLESNVARQATCVSNATETYQRIMPNVLLPDVVPMHRAPGSAPNIYISWFYAKNKYCYAPSGPARAKYTSKNVYLFGIVHIGLEPWKCVSKRAQEQSLSAVVTGREMCKTFK